MTCCLFVTARNADYKAVNRILLYLRDWEFGAGDSFCLVTSRHSFDPELENPHSAKSASPPVPSSTYDSWAGASIKDVESFMLDKVKDLPNHPVSPSLFLVIDDEGMETKTGVLAERYFDDETDSETDTFSKVRLPWEETYSMYCNLDIGNMDWADWCDEDEGPDEDGWWKFVSVHDGPDLSEENRKKRDETIEKFAEDGKL